MNIPVLYVTQFASNLQFLSQQKGSRLLKTVMTGNHEGSSAASPVDQIGSVNALRVTTRFAPMGRVDAAFDKRWVYPVDYELPQLVDSFDKLRLVIDPTSALSINGMYAMGRAQDDEIIAAFFGTAKTGVNGSTSTTFPTSQRVAVDAGAAGATGLTVFKLRAAKRILMANEVDIDIDELWCVVKAKEHDDLLGEAQVISTDFNEKPVLMDGKVVRFLGFNFVHSERLGSETDTLSGTSNTIPAYAKSGMYLGQWGSIFTDISRRNDLSGLPFQVYAKGTFGATRMEEKKVVKIQCRQ